MVDFSAPFDLATGSLYPATSLISMNDIAGIPDPTLQQEYVRVEGNGSAAKADQVRRWR